MVSYNANNIYQNQAISPSLKMILNAIFLIRNNFILFKINMIRKTHSYTKKITFAIFNTHCYIYCI
ncbi:hypothetical protein HMPREF3203_02049 [Proteus mirabilis]|nr:hypothetical protein HMPREF3203_02049 [Proteus mirabilis]